MMIPHQIFQGCLFVALIGFIFAQGSSQDESIEIDPKGQAVVRVGEDLDVKCRVAKPVTLCRLVVHSLQPLIISDPPKTSSEDIQYIGAGLDKGDCSIRIKNIKEAYNGKFECYVFPKGMQRELSTSTNIIIARPPQTPQIELSRSSSGKPFYKKGETLEISCSARGGSPKANVSIYLGDEKITNEDSPYYRESTGNDANITIEKVSRSLEWADHGKEVRCLASNIALERPLEVKAQLDVHYPPQEQPINERFGYVIGQQGVLNLTISANPKPDFTWILDGEEIMEGRTDSSNRLQTSSVYELGKGNWVAILTIDSVQKSDTERDYRLRASNEEGTFTYEVKISTSSEAPVSGVDLDAGSIIGIVIGVLCLILVVFLVIFARATGRWCFAGLKTSRNIGESDIADPAVTVNLLRFHKPKTDDASGRRSDTESAGRYSRSEVDSTGKRQRTPKITFSQLFKRNKDKVSGADTDTVRTNVTVDDEKETKGTGKAGEGGIVYAELDLPKQQGQQGARRIDENKTEYAEILYTKPEAEAPTPDK